MQDKESVDLSLLENIKRFGTDHPNRYNTIWERFIAGIIDTVLLMSLMFPIHLYVYDKWLISDIRVVYVWEILSEFIFYGYVIVFHGKYGRTIGKKVMGLKILDVKEQMEIGYRQAILRDIVPIFGVIAFCISKAVGFSNDRLESYDYVEGAYNWLLLIWFVAEIGTASMNKKRRALHDYLAGTVVVKF